MPPKPVSAAKAERHLAEVTAQKAIDRKVAEALDRAPPSVTARVDRAERWQTNTRWGDLSASQLGAVMASAQRGDIADFAELVEFAISTDEHLQSLYTTRLSRVSQAEYEIVPSPFGDPQLAQAAAAFVSEQMARVENYDAAIHKILHAIAIGYSASEMVWAQDHAGINYVQRIEFRHPRRFRFSPQWTLRLWDRGGRRGADSYGEMLDPRLWIVHEHQELAGYQGVGGVMNSCMWTWMFTRWVRKFWIGDVEKHGSPLVYAKVKANTRKDVRDQLLADLENLSADHVAVLEEGNEIVVEAAAQAAASKKHEEFMRFANEGLAKAWLGAGDAVDPGVNGARGAVETRMSATTDPRMVTDGKLFATSMRMSIIRQLINFNSHHITRDVDVSRIPLPIMRMKTAHDEVRPDMGAVAQDAKATVQGRVPEVQGPAADKPLDIPGIVREEIAGPEAKAPGTAQPAAPAQGSSGAPPALDVTPGASVQQQALNGAQVTSLLELLNAVAAGSLPRDSAIELIVAAFPVDRAQAERILGSIGQGFVPKAEPPKEPPPFAPPQDAAPAEGEPPKPDDGEPVAMAEPAPRKGKRPKAAAAGEPRQLTIKRCEAPPVSRRSRTTSPSQALQVALGKSAT